MLPVNCFVMPRNDAMTGMESTPSIEPVWSRFSNETFGTEPPEQTSRPPTKAVSV